MSDQCPACNRKIEKNLQTCPHCGYGFSLLTEYYKDHPLPENVGFLNDRADILSPEEVKKLEKVLLTFREKFPSFYFVVYLESEGEKPDTKGLWLHNEVDFTGNDKSLSRQHGVLLYLDPSKMVCSISVGLGLAQYFSLEESNKIVQDATNEFSEKNYFYGVNKVILNTIIHLEKKCAHP